MLVNNEIGVIQPVAEIAGIAHDRGALFFCDAVQGFGRVPIPLEACDLVALSAHKVHGPKGIGALWVRDGVDDRRRCSTAAGRRAASAPARLSPALCVGFGEAARLLHARREADHDHVERLWALARGLLPDWTLNGSADRRYHGNLNLRRDGVDAARLISEVREVAFSAGSACASGSGRPSHVLAALGLGDREARSSIRLGFGRYTSEDELRTALGLINEAARASRASPHDPGPLRLGRRRAASRRSMRRPASGCSTSPRMPASRSKARARGRWPARPATSSSMPRISPGCPAPARRKRTCSTSPPTSPAIRASSCQIWLTEALDTLTVRIPGGFHNMQGR